MTQKISGPGVGLPIPQNTYPTDLYNAPYDLGTNQITLAAGDAINVPAGEWFVGLGMYLVLQFLDPITGTWVIGASGGWEGPHTFVVSDGFNTRIANMLGCPIGGVVIAGGSGYVQASTTISVTGGGGSTWSPIVGGQLVTLAFASYGAGYGVAPLAILPPPPPASNNANGVGGIPASGYFTIASGTVSGFTFTNPGAGYPSGFTIVGLPNPTDPNLVTGITMATVSFSTTLSGSLTGVILNNPGAPLAPANLSLTVSGVGSSGSVNPIMLQTITTASVSGGGAGYGASGNPGALLTTVGGSPPTSTFANSPETLFLRAKPRPANIGFSVASGSIAAQQGAIYDGGLFYSTPIGVIVPGGQAGASGSVTGPTLVLTMGNRPDIAILQPAA